MQETVNSSFVVGDGMVVYPASYRQRHSFQDFSCILGCQIFSQVLFQSFEFCREPVSAAFVFQSPPAGSRFAPVGRET
jgi:hypothetical protein